MTVIPEVALVLQSLVTAEGEVQVRLGEVPVAAPGPGQVVVRVEAAPINPSDLGLLFAGADPTQLSVADGPVVTGKLSAAGVRASAKRVGEPLPVGNEGSGTVVAAGTDEAAQSLIGRLVGFAGGGSYAEYVTLSAAGCLPLPAGATAVDGAASFVNPLTALGMIEAMRLEGHTALVHTAAASNLGQMLNRLCLDEGIPLVSIVRSQAQAELLKTAGAQHVCDSSTEDFRAKLGDALRETGATLAFDAIGGGELAGRILSGMEAAASAKGEFSRYGSDVHKQVYVYGGLDRSPTVLNRDFGMAWSIGGWLLTPFLQRLGGEGVGRLRQRVADELTTTFASRYTDQVSLAGALTAEAIGVYARQATGSKYLITPHTT